MTIEIDAKQALEVVGRLRFHGRYATETQAECAQRKNAEREQAASLLSSLAEENERLRGALARIANTGQSAEPDHWKFRVRARAAARQALTTHPAQPEGEGHAPSQL